MWIRKLRWAGVTVLGLLTAPLHAQYFGQNKVQYRAFDFHVLRTEHFDVHYYPDEAGAARDAARMAERWYHRLSRFFEHELHGRQPLILYASHPEFEQTTVVGGELGEGTGGVTETLKRRIVLPLAGSVAETDHVIGHELVHAFQFDITGGRGRMSSRLSPGAVFLPLWFTEGMAEYLSKGPADPLTAMWMRAALDTRLPASLDELDDTRYFPYRFGQAFLAYVGGRFGDEVIAELLRVGGQRRRIKPAIEAVLGVPADTLVRQWQAALRESYASLETPAGHPDAAGWIRVTRSAERGTMNLAPALSPDGTGLMYLSSRDLFSIDLYYADATSGQIQRRITKTATDQHFQSLQFIQSAGAWDRVGRRFAFAAVSNGAPMLSIYDVAGGRTEREVRFKELGEIFNPAWSPAGQAIAFSALTGGRLDLYVYDLAAGRLRRLTDDAYADMQPALSPDGRQIAFATDRFTTSVERLDAGPLRLALIEPGTGAIGAVPGLAEADHINPQWVPGGEALLFVADPDGIPNVYRADLAEGTIGRVTDFSSGVSGITSLSPALSVAAESGRIVLSVYNGEGYDLYRRDSAGTVGAAAIARGRAAAVLPPASRSAGVVATWMADTTAELPAADSFATTSYRGKLTLDYVAPPTIAVGADRFGTYVGGGTALYFSDLLGRRELVVGLQANGDTRDIAALVGYTSRAQRFNWGVVAQQVPYRTGAFAVGTGTIDGEPVFIEQEIIFRQTNREVAFLGAYPFNRARRVEGSLAVRHVGFHAEQRTLAFSLLTGALLEDDTRDLPTSPGLVFGTASLALVHDNSVFGATSPILGSRARLEVSSTVGAISFVGALADARRYVMPVFPVTVAGRLLHYGRYGGDADDARLAPLFLGYEGLVRGYSVGSFEAAECEPPAGDPGACPVFDQLIGSRVLVGNVELRAPLLRLFGGRGYYGALPLELALFVDGGVAWDQSHSPSFSGGDREPVFSAGTALRLNLMGYLVLEGALVRPFDRPRKGWLFQLSLLPGF